MPTRIGVLVRPRGSAAASAAAQTAMPDNRPSPPRAPASAALKPRGTARLKRALRTHPDGCMAPLRVPSHFQQPSARRSRLNRRPTFNLPHRRLAEDGGWRGLGRGKGGIEGTTRTGGRDSSSTAVDRAHGRLAYPSSTHGKPVTIYCGPSSVVTHTSGRPQAPALARAVSCSVRVNHANRRNSAKIRDQPGVDHHGRPGLKSP